jgi:LmbE family N-acetylglucosaminyl deacetylase
MRHLLSGIIALSVFSTLHAQQVRPANSQKIYHEIAQLQNLVNVLYVAAHPDDENTKLLAWLVNERNIRTGYLSLTRGDGGQNILGSEQDEALGLIRTHELIEARNIDGAEQYFTRAVDFGFSKTHEETFKHWPQNQLTYDAVWVMRKFRPDVVICRFPPDTMAGHGQHAASAIIGAKAFKAAGDKQQYPEQLSHYNAWQPKRIVFNSFKFGTRSTVTEDQYKMAIGDYVPGMGKGTGELAGESRSIHKSQGAGTASVPGLQTEYFKLVDGEPFTTSLFEGIDTTWSRVGRPDIGSDIQQILFRFDPNHPDASIPYLAAVRKKIEEVKDAYWRKQKLDELDQILLDCTGLLAELTTKQPTAIRGANVPFTLRVIARSATPVVLQEIQWGNGDSTANMRMPWDTLVTMDHSISIPANAPLTQPYWLANERPEKGMYAIPNDSLIGLPETPVALYATLLFNVGGVTIPVKVPLSYKKLDPVKGDVVEQLRIVPDAIVSFTNTLLIAEKDGAVEADVKLKAYRDIKQASLKIYDKNGVVLEIPSIHLNAGIDTVITIHVPGNKKRGKDDFYLYPAIVVSGQSEYNLLQHVIQYNHLPTLQYFKKASALVLIPTWESKAKQVGYIEGAGDFIPSFLKLSGIEVTILRDADLAHAENLEKYDAIITGIRAANVEKRMAYWLPVLLEYVQRGGTLVMQYNTTQDLSTNKLGPYPFTLSTQRVTEENAKVSLLEQKHKLLNSPNKITDIDFSDWVQERGLYFPSSCDNKYTPLFQMNDAGEQPLSNCTLYAKYGKGNYIYTTLSFSRQLPAGNKGAIRLLMNMLSIGN